MGNIISNDKVDSQSFSMSNTLTDVFIAALCISGAELAKADFEKDLLIWFAQQDQSFRGSGTVGFDIKEIVWNHGCFNDQKIFLLNVIKSTFNKKNWHLFEVDINENMLFGRLEIFKNMIKSFRKDLIELQFQENIMDFDGEIKKYDSCEKHLTYKHWCGCNLCIFENSLK